MARKPILSTQREVRGLFFKVTGTGTAAISEGNNDATLTDNGTGDYTLTFTVPFSRPLTAHVSVETSGAGVGAYGTIQASTFTASAIRILTTDETGAAADTIFWVTVFGEDQPY